MSKVPAIGKRSQVVEALAASIRRGDLSPGERLGGENELARRFDVSRGTIRSALDELKRRNLITTRTGIGSFVTFDGVALDQSIGWARALADAGGEIVTDVLGIEPAAWPDHLPTDDLSAEVIVDAIRIRRLRRLADGLPISYETSFVPASGVLAELPRTGLRDGSLWASLEEAGLRAIYGEQQVRVVRLDDLDARTLHREPGTSFLCTERTSYGSDGGLVEHVIALLDPDHFRLSLTFGETP